MKLHLGCGQRYFEGYVNIDFPLTEHTVQQDSVADELANLLELKYADESIDEVRLHHVFEHFSRPVTCALLTNWYGWLKMGGVLHIEVPDFERTAKAALSIFSSEKEKFVAMRHIFGSQEAHWAVHYEGYSPKSLSRLMETFGFEVTEIRKNDHKGTYNVEVLAKKKEQHVTLSELTNRAEAYQKNYLVDESVSELMMLNTWMDIYRQHLTLPL